MIQRFLSATALSLVALTILATTTLAHHGWSEYDEKTPLTVAGKITESSYQPARHLKLGATDGGKVWDVVLAPVARMQTRGLTEAMLKPGTVVTVLGYQHRKTTTEMRAENITVNKKKVELR